MKEKLFFVVICFSLLCTSCTRIFYKVYGIELADELDESKYGSNLSQLKSLYPEGNITSLISTVNNFQQVNQSFADLGSKNLSQPVQILYFENKQLFSYHLNCYARGGWMGNLDWNYDHKFDSYVPKTAYTIPDSMSANLDDLLTIYRLEQTPSKDVIVLFWSNMFKKHVISAFQTVVNNIKAHAKYENPQIILINIDEYLIQEFLQEKE
ncbi:MAG: hypothetical protein ACI35V_07450 [Sphingobacterium composti]|uniref:hypothetical protein n=1 Tax=Sphingobacterium composti TaxID=363260 RepID=UPI00135BC30D|nr:hypothetical protein [Sphingobacterium composti Ten et al. 2007 non Yoo et al. 2007]